MYIHAVSGSVQRVICLIVSAINDILIPFQLLKELLKYIIICPSLSVSSLFFFVSFRRISANRLYICIYTYTYMCVCISNVCGTHTYACKGIFHIVIFLRLITLLYTEYNHNIIARINAY